MEHPPVAEQESKYMKNSVNLCKSVSKNRIGQSEL